MRPAPTCCDGSARTVKRPRATRLLSASSVTMANVAFSNDVCAKSPRARTRQVGPNPGSLDSVLSVLSAGGHRGEALADLFLGYVFLVCGDRPVVAERIFQCARAVTIELILHRILFSSAGVDRLLENRVAIF